MTAEASFDVTAPSTARRDSLRAIGDTFALIAQPGMSIAHADTVARRLGTLGANTGMPDWFGSWTGVCRNI